MSISVSGVKSLLLLLFFLDLISLCSLTALVTRIFGKFPFKSLFWSLLISLTGGLLYHGVKGCVLSTKKRLEISLGLNAIRLIVLFVVVMTPWRISLYCDIMSSLSVVQIILTILLMTILSETTDTIISTTPRPVGDGVVFTPLYSKTRVRNYESAEQNNNSVITSKTRMIKKPSPKFQRRRKSSAVAVPTQPAIHEEAEEVTESQVTPKLDHQTSGLSESSTKTTSTTLD